MQICKALKKQQWLGTVVLSETGGSLVTGGTPGECVQSHIST